MEQPQVRAPRKARRAAVTAYTDIPSVQPSGDTKPDTAPTKKPTKTSKPKE